MGIRPRAVARGRAVAYGLVLGIVCFVVAPASAPASAPEGPAPAPAPEPAPAPAQPPTPASAPESTPAADAPAVPAPRVEAEIIRVAVGLTPQALGSAQEREIVDRLERSVARSTEPRTAVRRLRAGASEPRRICREGLDDLVIAVGYMPDDPRPVLISHDCRLDVELGARSAQAAADPNLVRVLWREHRDRIAAGAEERRRKISPRLRNGLIIGAAAVVITAAAAILLANALRQDTVVLKVAP